MGILEIATNETPPLGASSVQDFCKRWSIGRTTFYEEANSGRLILSKIRGKTVVTRAHEAAWAASLSIKTAA